MHKNKIFEIDNLFHGDTCTHQHEPDGNEVEMDFSLIAYKRWLESGQSALMPVLFSGWTSVVLECHQNLVRHKHFKLCWKLKWGPCRHNSVFDAFQSDLVITLVKSGWFQKRLCSKVFWWIWNSSTCFCLDNCKELHSLLITVFSGI